MTRNRKEYMDKWRAENPDKRAAYQQKTYERMMASPEGRAAAAAKSKRWREANREKYLESLRKSRQKHAEARKVKDLDRQARSKYGIGLVERDEMLAAQGGACAACGAKTSGSKRGWGWHIDHCHSTGKIRGILCHHCNVSLGMVRDNPEHLRNLIAYLEINSDNN